MGARVVNAPSGISNSRTKSWSFRSFRSVPTFKRRFSELPPVLSATFDDTDQGYLLKGINNCSSAAFKLFKCGSQSFWQTILVTIFLYFNFYIFSTFTNNVGIVSIQNFFGGKKFYTKKYNSKPFCFFIKSVLLKKK